MYGRTIRYNLKKFPKASCLFCFTVYRIPNLKFCYSKTSYHIVASCVSVYIIQIEVQFVQHQNYKAFKYRRNVLPLRLDITMANCL